MDPTLGGTAGTAFVYPSVAPAALANLVRQAYMLVPECSVTVVNVDPVNFEVSVFLPSFNDTAANVVRLLQQLEVVPVT